MSDVTVAFAALGDPTRRAIFERLARRPSSVGDLAAHFPVSRPAVSQHLRVLKDAGLVSDRAEGNRRFYGVDPRRIESLREYFDKLWPRALDAFKREVERQEREKEGEGKS
jgi:DNA-binding transcriptional ArsR family regulator